MFPRNPRPDSALCNRSRRVRVPRRIAVRAWLAIAFMLWLPLGADARTIQVGSGGDFSRLEDAVNGNTYGAGDTIAVLPGTYEVSSMLQPRGSGAAGSPIVVRGIGSSRPIVSGVRLTNSKALWDFEQSNSWWVVEHLCVRGMRGAQTNARGFMVAASSDIVLHDLEITDCWNGIMTGTGAARLTVQFCDIHDNGGLTGPAHNIYLSGGADHIVRHNWIHDAHYGMNFKDRTRNLQLLYNWIENADQGGYEVSLAGQGSLDRGRALVVGNVIVKSATSAQQTHCIRFEDARVGTLDMLNNTVIARSNNIVVYSIASTTTLRNNLFAGGRTLVATDGAGRVITGSHNWVKSGVTLPSGLTLTQTGTEPGFADDDWALAAGSPCIDAGDGSNPLPEWQYASPAGRVVRTLTGGAVDIGAFEYGDDSAPADTIPPDAPTSVVATALDATHVRLGWSAAADAVEFVIERALGDGAWDAVAGVASSPYTDSGLAAATLYRYRVRARDESGNESAVSEVASATTTPASAAATTLEILVGALAAGNGADLDSSDDAAAVVRAAGSGRSYTADLHATSTLGTGDGALRVDYDLQSTAAVKVTVYLWRWTHHRWDSKGALKLAAGTAANGSVAIAALPSRYLSATGAVRVRLRARGKAAFDLALDELHAARAGTSSIAAVPLASDGEGDGEPGDDLLAATGEVRGDATVPPATEAFARVRHVAGGVRFDWGSTVPAPARVELFDVRGRRLATLAPSTTQPSSIVWDGRDAAGRTIGRGVVFARITTAHTKRSLRFVWQR